MRLAFLTIAVLASAAMPSFGAPNLFINPGFENGNLTGWNLSSCLWTGVVGRGVQAAPGCPDVPATINGSNYVYSGNYGTYLGYGEPDPLATLTQTVSLAKARYRVDFYYKELDAYPNSPDNLLEVVWGTSLNDLISAYLEADTAATNGWRLRTVRFDAPSAGTYVVGFRFFNVWGEWALDSTNLSRNPEPGTLAMMAAPLAWLAWKRRRSLKRTAQASGS